MQSQAGPQALKDSPWELAALRTQKAVALHSSYYMRVIDEVFQQELYIC